MFLIKMIDYQEYREQFSKILDGECNDAPYDDERFVEYVKLNKSRTKRWERSGKLLSEVNNLIQSIREEQEWIVITEPWCGDAAHIVPFIAKMAELNANISLKIQNRDTEKSEIDNYLTNGGRSIPKLIVRNSSKNDLFVWGPRPKEAQDLYLDQKDDNSKSATEKKAELQSWYNKNKGEMLQREIAEHLKMII
jgi:hypothetical protein